MLMKKLSEMPTLDQLIIDLLIISFPPLQCIYLLLIGLVYGIMPTLGIFIFYF